MKTPKKPARVRGKAGDGRPVMTTRQAGRHDLARRAIDERNRLVELAYEQGIDMFAKLDDKGVLSVVWIGDADLFDKPLVLANLLELAHVVEELIGASRAAPTGIEFRHPTWSSPCVIPVRIDWSAWAVAYEARRQVDDWQARAAMAGVGLEEYEVPAEHLTEEVYEGPGADYPFKVVVD